MLEEFQAKSIMSGFGIRVAAGVLAATPDGAAEAAEEQGLPVMVKAQVRAGGRGRAGGVRMAGTAEEARSHAASILGMEIGGFTVERVLVYRRHPVGTELYAGIAIDRRRRLPVLVTSAEGGIGVEEAATARPDGFAFLPVDPCRGLRDFEARGAAGRLLPRGGALSELTAMLAGMWRCFRESDALMLEINPLALLEDGTPIAIDARMEIDDNALSRHPEIGAMMIPSAKEAREVEARSRGLSYVGLDGCIGCMVNGAGLAMCTMDAIVRLGGRPANFLDIGGSSSPGKVLHAFRLVAEDPGVRVILVNVFGGITRCDDVARGLVEALGAHPGAPPLVVRLSGTNEDEGRAILASHGIAAAREMDEAAARAIALAGPNAGDG